MLFATLAMLVATPVAQTRPMSVADVMAKADAIQRKGMLAIFSSEVGAIKAEAQEDVDAFGRELANASQTHRPLPACPPTSGPNSFKFTVDTAELLQYYRSLPAADRSLSSRQAFAQFMSRKFPCHGR